VTPAPLVFLDFDDVLVDTRQFRLTCLRAALASAGGRLTDDTFDTQCAGLSASGAARAAFRAAGTGADDTAVELAGLHADRAFAAIASRGLPLAPGVRDFVRRAAGCARLGIVTAAARRDVELVLALAELDDAFECVVTCDESAGPGPSWLPFEQAVVRMASRGEVIVGQGVALVASLNGIATARAAGLQSIVVGPVAPLVAFAGDGYLESLEGVRVQDLVRIATGSKPS
jgi:beta-phosphoglucomutase-like phosphatase (HAD superfamily)